jgi:hypothetical protein
MLKVLEIYLTSLLTVFPKSLVKIHAVKIYVAAVEALKKKERQDETQFITKIGGKTSLGSQLFCFVKISFPITILMPNYAETGHSCPLIM